ncbi:unnamed protein product [Meloidogyne enterolobii]|uniref:Uncharacterized protein n=1 Tax=Meloidogyne enterolobii TaxID=390850 RepID=A0ACB0XN80_MELEN
MFIIILFLLFSLASSSNLSLVNDPRWQDMWKQEPCRCPKYLLNLPFNVTGPIPGRCECPIHLLKSSRANAEDFEFYRLTPFRRYGIKRYNDSLQINELNENITIATIPHVVNYSTSFNYLIYSKWWFIPYLFTFT